MGELLEAGEAVFTSGARRSESVQRVYSNRIEGSNPSRSGALYRVSREGDAAFDAERVEVLLEPLLGGLARIDGAADTGAPLRGQSCVRFLVSFYWTGMASGWPFSAIMQLRTLAGAEELSFLA